MKKRIYSVLFIVLVAAGCQPVSLNPKPVACTTEAFVCPDGTAVGRTGPNCTFAPCPTATSTNPGGPNIAPPPGALGAPGGKPTPQTTVTPPGNSVLPPSNNAYGTSPINVPPQLPQ